jgi:hypothetical protein
VYRKLCQKSKSLEKKKKFLLGLGILILIIIIGLLAANWYLKKEIKAELEEGKVSQHLSYEDLSVNLLTQNASLSKPVWLSDKLHVQATSLQLKNFSIWNYISNGVIEIEELFLLEPEVTIFENVPDDEEPGEDDIEEEIKIGRLSIMKGSFQMKSEEGAENDLYLSLLSLDLRGIQLNNSTQSSGIPFNYDDLTVETDSLFYDLNPEHTLAVESISLKEGDLGVNNLRILPKYSKAGHDRAIPHEKDRVDVNINTVKFRNFHWGVTNDSLMISSPEVEIAGANAEIYRNKLLPDDQRIKPMYSEMLRELGIKLKIDTINLRESTIVYEERVLEKRPAGTLKFGNVQATINNLTNANIDGEDFPMTTIEARANFMDQSKITLNWEFDVSNLRDEFQVKGSFEGIDAEAINPFMKPAMNVETEGKIESLYYNFYGNKNEATGDMKLAYRDFKISILKDGEEEERSFLSGLVNLILKNDVVNEDVSQENINVERDKTKSIWNFFWLCIREGSLKTFL